MSYQETLDFLYSQLPMYSRIGKAAYKKDLTNTLQLCKLLDHPEKKFKSIHVAGTNGKGSTCHMLAAILQTAGYKTGLHTSPHLKDFRERIRINGRMIPKKHVTLFVEKHQSFIQQTGASFFEATVAMAFEYFAKEKVDIAVIEVGLGGRLDSTNVIMPILSVITNISWDHTDMLGDTLEKIALEKAGIIKPGVPVVIGEMDEQSSAIFISKANEMNAPITFATEDMSGTRLEESPNYMIVQLHQHGNNITQEVQLDLTGIYQIKNLITVLEACRVLEYSNFPLKTKKIFNAIKQVKKLTGLRGRWELLRENPTVIADVAHNTAGLKLNLDYINEAYSGVLHFVIGFVKEKDLNAILPLFPKNAQYYFCKADIPRGHHAQELQKIASNFNLQGNAYPSVQAAYQAALEKASGKDVVYVGGSTFVVAEVI